MSNAVRLCGTVLLGCLLAFCVERGLAQGDKAKDEKPGIKPVEPRKDPKTGFVVGGKNDTALIRTLTEINGVKIAAASRRPRPNKGKWCLCMYSILWKVG